MCETGMGFVVVYFLLRGRIVGGHTGRTKQSPESVSKSGVDASLWVTTNLTWGDLPLWIKTSTIWCAEQIQISGYLQSCLHSRDSSTTEGASVILVSTAVGLTNTQEEHAGRQTRRQRQGADNTDVWSTDRESSNGRGNTARSYLSAVQELQ